MRKNDQTISPAKFILWLLDRLCRLLAYSTGQRDHPETPAEQRLRDHSCLLVILGISRFRDPSRPD